MDTVNTVYVHTRAQWGALDPARDRNPIGAHPLGVAVHWLGPGVGTWRHDQCAAKVRGIQHFHMAVRGWADIAYNYLTCPHGAVFEGRGLNHGSAANGGTQANEDWYAVCAMVGEGDPQPPALLDGIRDAITICRQRAGSRIVGHRDLFGTECPGGSLYAAVRSGALNPTPAPAPKDWFDMATKNELEEVVRGLLTTNVGRTGLSVGTLLERTYRAVSDPDALADAIAARLPDADADQVKAAVKAALREGVQ